MKSPSSFDNASLEELEGDVWVEASYPSHVVLESHRLRRVHLRLLTTENLRLLIGQGIGLRFLVPRALALLRSEPLVEGDFYPGDLLCAVLQAGSDYWRAHPDQHAEVRRITVQAQPLADSQGKVVAKAIAEAHAAFEQDGHGSNNKLQRKRGAASGRADG